MDKKQIEAVYEKILLMVDNIQSREHFLLEVLGEAHVISKLPAEIRQTVERDAESKYNICNASITQMHEEILAILPKGEFFTYGAYDFWRVDDTIFAEVAHPYRGLVCFYWHRSDRQVSMSSYAGFSWEQFPIKQDKDAGADAE